MFSTGQHQLCMPTGQHQLCMLRTISNRIRIEYIWLQHMIQVRILGNNKGARHPQDLRQWPLSFLLCQTPAFLQQSFFPTKVCFPHQLPRTAHFIRFGRLIWLIVGMARSGVVTFHAMVVDTGQHPIVDTFIDSTFKNLLAPPRLLDILNRFFWWRFSETRAMRVDLPARSCHGWIGMQRHWKASSTGNRQLNWKIRDAVPCTCELQTRMTT